MSLVSLPLRMQPQVPFVDRDNPLMVGITEIAVPPHFKSVLRSASMSIITGTGIEIGPAGGIGNAYRFTTSVNAQGIFVGQANVVAPHSSDFTAFVLRRCRDTTGRNATLFGYKTTNSDLIMTHAPYTDGNLYWDYGNNTAGSGRVSVAFTKTTKVEALVFIAGGGKGREVWRDGVKIVGNTGATATRTPNTQDFVIGGISASPAVASDIEEVFLFGTLGRAWSDAEVAAWTANPWGIFVNPNVARRWSVIGATGGGGGGGGLVRPNVFICT